MRVWALGFIAAAWACLCSATGAAQDPSPAPAVPMQSFRIAAVYPHDSDAFTQGLFVREGQLYESTGQLGESSLRIVRLSDGTVLASGPLPRDQFGEGSTDWGDEIVSLTWQHGIGYRWDAKTLARKSSFTYSGEGWGLTNDGTSLILSDGTPWLRFLDPVTFAEQRRLQVTLRGRPLRAINEIEWVEGEIWANVWQTDFIVRIDPASGAVKAVVDLRTLDGGPNEDEYDNVLNGIAYDRVAKRLYVTGKRWSKLYEIVVPPVPSSR